MSKQTKSRVIRTLMQLIAGGALLGLTDQIAKDVPAAYAPYVALGYALLVALAQNLYEDWKQTDVVASRTPVEKNMP